MHKISLGVSVITMIGYGDIVPRTKWGKIGVIIYACLGIPVYILYFTNIGKVFAAPIPLFLRFRTPPLDGVSVHVQTISRITPAPFHDADDASYKIFMIY